MTIGTDIWRLVRQLVGDKCFVLAKKDSENYAIIKEALLYVQDALFMVRKIFVCNADGTVRLDCFTILQSISRHIFGIFENTDVQTYVFCLDECVVPRGMEEQVGRMEKAHTAKGRARQSSKQTPLQPLPEGRAGYFVDGLPVLGDMNAIFSDKRARRELYAYITAYFCSEQFRSCIPEGKRVVLSGGLGDDLEPILPLSVSSDDVGFVTDMPVGRMAEGDLDVLRWLFRFPGDVVVESGDGDVLLYTLMQIRNIARLDPKRKVYFRTERSAGVQDIASQLPPREVLEEIFEQSASSSSSSSKKRKSEQQPLQVKRQKRIDQNPKDAGKKVQQYVNIGKMRKLIINSAVAHVSAPVEELVLAIIIATSKHDFFYRKSLVYYVNEEDVFLAYLKWQHKIGPMVSVFQYEREDPSLPHHHLYRIDRRAVDRFVDFCYYTSLVKQMVKKGKLGEGDLNVTEPISSVMETARENRVKFMQRKAFLDGLKKDCGEDAAKLSLEDRLAAGCAQLAWVLHYGGNAPINDVKLVRGSERDEQSGKLLYGYTPDGFCLDIANPSSNFFQCG
jgi:hypothetical protein